MYKILITKYEKLTPEEIEKEKVRIRESREYRYNNGISSPDIRVDEYRDLFKVADFVLTDEEFQAVKKVLVETL